MDIIHKIYGFMMDIMSKELLNRNFFKKVYKKMSKKVLGEKAQIF